MALSVYARRALVYALKSTDIGDEIADVIDNGSGTLSVYARRRLASACANEFTADAIADNIDAGTALDDREKSVLAAALMNRVAAGEIITELAAP